MTQVLIDLATLEQLEIAIDGGGNTYYRPADARQCVSAIETLKGK